MADSFLGEIRMVSFNFAPRGWALANGQQLPLNQNQALFSLLGTTYGGNGQTTFALPDFRGRTPIHAGQGHAQGERGGESGTTLNLSQVPSHTHFVSAIDNASVVNSNNPTGNFFSNTQPNNLYSSSNANIVTLNPGTVSNAGGSQAHLNMQPFLTLNFCIALQGVFPSQN